MRTKRLGRREFTAGLGASLLASPLLQFLGGEAQAATPVVAKRLIVFFTPNGTVHQHWRPTGTESNFAFASGSILEPLKLLKDKLLICDGLDFVGADNHDPGMSHMLTGSGLASSTTAGMSIDQYVASKIGQGSRFKSLEFGVQTSAWGASRSTRMSYSAPGLFVPPEDLPLNAYQRLFGALGDNSSAAERLLRRRKSMLDLARTELNDLSAQVGAEEQIKLEQHLEALRQTEKGLSTAGSPSTCTAGTKPAIADPQAYGNFPQVGRIQTDLMVNALACGMTRVASIQWSHTIAPQVFTWAGASEAHHELSHKVDSNTAGVASFVKCERWFAEQFAYLLTSLQSRPDLETSGSTLLDTTLVLWAKELGDSRLHTCRSVPLILAGGSKLPFRFGRYLKFNGMPHQKLLTSICHGMGLTLDTFGDAARSTGALSGLV